MMAAVARNGDGRPCCPERSRVQGFILPLTLWMIAIMGLLASSLNIWVAKAVANATTLARSAELELAQANLRNELVYFLGARASSYRGLEVGPRVAAAGVQDFDTLMAGPQDSGRTVKFDGRPYISQSHPDIVIMVQDGTGLFNLNISTPQNLRRLLTSFDVEQTAINRMIDTLLDYMDDDDLTRLAGAESALYARQGMAPPVNGFLMSPYETQRVMGWERTKSLWEADLKSPLLTTCQSAGFNPNNAPPAALVANIRGMTGAKAEQVIAYRADKPFRNMREFGAAADLLVTDEPFFYTFIPGACSVVDLIDKRSGQHVRFSLTLEPISQTRPWRVDYATRIPDQYRDALDRLDPEAIFPTPESIDLPLGPDGAKTQPQ
jgi:DNA uptake protein ComE-like DNA-binding protein